MEVYDPKARNNFNYQDIRTDRAKDKAHMEHHEKKSEQLAQSLKAQGLTLGGVEFFEHESRRDRLSGGLKNYTPTLFALNSSTQERIDNPQRYYLKKGIKNPLFAETVERDSTRFLSVDSETTNHAIALDNYDFFLNHSEEIRTNLARVLLAKLDLDIDHKKTLDDLLNNDQWKSASGEEVFHELKNRLRQRGKDLNDQYIPIFKLLSQGEEIAGKQAMFLSERLRVQEEIYEQISSNNDPLKNVNFRDNTQRERAKELFRQLSGHFHQSNGSIGKTLDELIKKENMEANELYRLLSDNQSFLTQSSKGFIERYEEAEEKKQRFITLHNQNIEKSTQAVEKIAFKSKSYPVAILASLADEKFFLQNADRNELNDIEKNLKAELRKVLPETIDVNTFVKNLKEKLEKNKELFEHIYDASKDSYNAQRQYMPFESVKMHDTAGNIIRDTLYIQLMQEEGKELYSEFFDDEKEKNILSVSLDPDINKHKPELDEVNDTFNAISMVNKVTMGEISKKDADIIFDSPMFKESTVFNQKEIEGIKDFTSNLAETTKVLNSKEIVGTAKEKELQESIQEMHYLAYSRKLMDKMHPDKKEKNAFKKLNNFIGRNFFQNNKALYQMQECMKTALNPTTGVETIPSLSRNCIDKLKEAYSKEAQNADAHNSSFRGWLGVSFLGFINQMMPVIARAKEEMLNSLIDEMNAKISDDSTYTNSARNDYERQARMMNVENKNGFMANHLIATSHAGDFRDEIEKEHTTLALMKTEVKTKKLIFENIWQPKEYQDSIAIKSELEKLKEQSEELKQTLVENAAKKAPGEMSAEEKKALETIEAIDIREKELKGELRNFEEMAKGRTPAVIKSELEQLKNQSENFKGLLIERATGKAPGEINDVDAELNKLIEDKYELTDKDMEIVEAIRATDGQEKKLRKELLKMNEMAGDRSPAVIKSELEQLKNQSEELKQTLAMSATEKDREILEALKDIEKREKELKEKLRGVNQGAKDRSPSITQNERKNRTEIKLDKVEGKGLLTTIAFLGTLKNEIDDKLHEGRLSGELSERQINRYTRDREKAVEGINELQRRAIIEPELLADALLESFSKQYNIALDAKTLKKNIGKDGLNSKAINLILDSADHLSKTQRLKIRSELFDMNAGLAALNKEGVADSKYANRVSSLLDTIRESEMFDIFKNNNDTYVSTDNMGDGMTHIRSMEGEVGRYIEKMDHLSSMISTEKNPELKNKMREELSELVDLGKNFQDYKGINFGEYEEMVTKQAHSHNDLQTVNASVLHKSTEIRRQI